MTRKWHRFQNPWDREYAMRGALWRGVSGAQHLVGHAASGARVLELGCGDGKFLQGLGEGGWRPLGVDFSPHALRLARQRVDVPLVLGDARRLPFADGAVPVVAAGYVLGALVASDRLLAAREMQRVCAADGVIVVEEFAREDFRYGTGRLVEEHTFERNQGILTHYFARGEVLELFPGWAGDVESLQSVQRVGARRAPRRRWRWVLRRQSSPKESMGSDAAGDR